MQQGAESRIEMLCSYYMLLYPKPPKTSDNGYSVAKYIAVKNQKGPSNSDMSNTTFTAVGYNLPTAAGIEYKMSGEWTKSKFGTQFEVVTYEEVVLPTEKGIKAYLGSGIIKGIGPKTAEKIYDVFGNKTLEVLDSSPERLMEVPGIREKTHEKIMASYISMRGARDIISLLAPYGISPNRCVRIYAKYGVNAVSIIQKNPYTLSEMTGVGFHTADKIAQSIGIPADSPFRIKSAILHTIREAETGGMLFRGSNEPSGNLCLPQEVLIGKTQLLLETDLVTAKMIAAATVELIKKEVLAYRLNRFVYRKHTDKSEGAAAKALIEIKNGKPKPLKNLQGELRKAQIKLNCRLAPEQQEAVLTTLSNSLSIVTGGPGTGKTMIQAVILTVLRAQYPKADIMMMAPTGRAARRMTESTGFPATTIHRALGLQVTDDDEEMPTAKIEADFVIVDEMSMLDIFLASALFTSIRPGTRVLLVGDSDQLPSVGPGAVLADIIKANCVPVVRLTKVYRQAGASLIAINSAKMRSACTELEKGDDFRIVPASTFEDAASIMERLYLDEVQINGIDNVVILCPFRKKTESGVNSMNKRLQAIVNPKQPRDKELTKGEKVIRKRDRVMITKNEEDLANGDIGYVTDIYEDDGEWTADIDFGEGRVYQCTSSNMDNIELAYATTIHKSQGSEYRVVICNIMQGHYIMLKRNLLYTAVTRAKKKVYVVGQQNAIEKAIKTEDTSKRLTLMPSRLGFYDKYLKK